MLISPDSMEMGVTINLCFSFFFVSSFQNYHQGCILINGFQLRRTQADFLEVERGSWLTASIRPFTVGDFNIKASNTSSVSFLTYKSTEKQQGEKPWLRSQHNFATATGHASCHMSVRDWRHLLINLGPLTQMTSWWSTSTDDCGKEQFNDINWQLGNT